MKADCVIQAERLHWPYSHSGAGYGDLGGVIVEDQLSNGDFGLQKSVAVWLVDLDDRSVGRDVLDAILAPDELERAARFVFEPDEWHFRVCRVALRLCLSLYTGAPAAQIHLLTGGHGKPYVAGCGIHFNVSHCGGVGLLAFTRVGEIGVDVEAVQPDIEGFEIASEHFTASEAAWIAAADGGLERAQRFTRLWTRKEAVLKATGKGIVEGLNSFDISNASTATVRIGLSREVDQVTLYVRDLSMESGIYGAIAGPDSGWEIQRKTARIADLLERVGTRFL
jgi:4'-phosphopantetheinyl transferase